MLAWFSENDPLRRAAKPQFNPHLHASCVLLAFTAALLVSYVAKLVLVVPLVTESFSVSRFTLQEVTPTSGTLPLGSILGTGAQAVPGPVPQLIDGGVQVLPRPRSAVVALLSKPLASTLFITNATMWNATAGVTVTHALSRMLNASNSDPLTPGPLTPYAFFPMMNFPSTQFRLNWSDPDVAAMQCMSALGPVPPGAERCFLDLQLSACPLNVPCMLDRASAAYFQRKWGAAGGSYSVRADTTWMVRVPAGQIAVAVVRASVVARSVDDAPFYTDPTVPRLSLVSRQIHVRPALCGVASSDVARRNMKHWEVPLCPDPDVVLEVHVSELVQLWLTSRAVSQTHLVVMVLAAMVSVFSIAKRMFGLATLGVRKCSGGRCGAVPVWAFALHVSITAFALFAAGLFTAVLLSNVSDDVELGNNRTVASAVFAWYLLAAIALAAAGLARLPHACAKVRPFACSPALAQRFAKTSVRIAFVLMAPEMVAFYGAYYFAEQAFSGPQSVDWWRHDTLLLGREVTSLVLVMVIRWLEWYNPESVFWDSTLTGRSGHERRLSFASLARRRRRGFMGSGGKDFSRGPCRGRRCCTMRCFQSATFLVNLVTAFVVLIVNERYTSNKTVARVVLGMFGSGCCIALTALAGAQAASCVRRGRMMLQAALVVGAVLCLSGATLAPWALSELERVVAHPNAEKLVGNYKERLIVLSTQVPLLVRCALIVSSASFWLLHMAFDLEPTHVWRVLAAARRNRSPRHSNDSYDAYAELAGSSDDDFSVGDGGMSVGAAAREASEAKLRRGLPRCCFAWCCKLHFDKLQRDEELAVPPATCQRDETRVSWSRAASTGTAGAAAGAGSAAGGLRVNTGCDATSSTWTPLQGRDHTGAMDSHGSGASMFASLRSRSRSGKRHATGHSTAHHEEGVRGASAVVSGAGLSLHAGLSLQDMSGRDADPTAAPAVSDVPGAAAGSGTVASVIAASLNHDQQAGSPPYAIVAASGAGCDLPSTTPPVASPMLR